MAQLWSDTPLPRAIATTGDKPQAYVTYAASTKASGSAPSEERVYVQSIDLATCTAGERIDVLGEPLDDPVQAAPAFVGATEDTLGISIFGQHIDRKTESTAPSVVGFNVKDSSLAWTLPSPGKQVLFEPLDAAGLFAVHLNSLDADKNSLVSVQTGKPVAETMAESESNLGPDEFGEPTLDWGNGKYLYSTHNIAEAQQFIVDGDKTTPVTDPVFSSDGVGFDTDQNQIVVGFSNADDSDGGLVVLDESGATKSIMSRDEFSDRSAEIMGTANGLVYLRTSDGNITVDLEGEIVGDPLDIKEHPLMPDSQRIVGGQVVTLWKTKELLTRDAAYPAAITLVPAVVPGAVPAVVPGAGPSDSTQ
ncbi:hypothetical protein JT358_13825 [Micrococcales bacterium 31B]|nr:hypothetical protein [Micrococcales bacterium 31B]